MNFELFDARNETAPNHTKSIQICAINTTRIPTKDHIIIASEINFNPILIHQIKKNGFNPVSMIPVSSGFCFEMCLMFLFFFIVDLICIAAKANNAIAPRIEIIVLNSGNNSSEKTPIPNKIINGNSTIVCPIASFMPDFVPSLMPHAMFAANNGPGDMTPEADIITTMRTNSKT